MGWQDRDYHRGPQGGGGLMWLVRGSVPLFTVFGIDVRMHAILLITLILSLVFGLGPGFGFQDRLESSIALFTIVLLHEFGHCFAARWVGGEADQIIMHPLGGLALCQPPHRPLPTFLTVAGGPAVNVLICLVCGAILFFSIHWLPPNPFNYVPLHLTGGSDGLRRLVGWSFWIYQMSWSLLIFNLLPIFPLDGGQMLQAAMWPKLGFYRSMKLSCEIGMGAAGLFGVYALASGMTGGFGLFILAAMGFYTCYVMRLQLMANDADEFESISYAVGPAPVRTKRPRKSWVKTWRDKRQKAIETDEAVAVDQILDKVAKEGMHSLTSGEKRTLNRASENQRKRDAQRARR